MLTRTLDGAAGSGSAGVAATYHGAAAGAGLLSPLAFTARSLKRCSVPFVSPSTVAVAALPATAVQSLQATPARRTLYS